MSWFKRTPGDPTLADRHAEATAAAHGALSMFHGIVEDLSNAAADLRTIAEEAQREAKALLVRADAAAFEAEQHTNAAAKVSSLLS